MTPPHESNSEAKRTEGWLIDIILPMLFSIVLASCMIHLGFCISQDTTWFKTVDILYATPL